MLLVVRNRNRMTKTVSRPNILKVKTKQILRMSRRLKRRFGTTKFCVNLSVLAGVVMLRILQMCQDVVRNFFVPFHSRVWSFIDWCTFVWGNKISWRTSNTWKFSIQYTPELAAQLRWKKIICRHCITWKFLRLEWEENVWWHSPREDKLPALQFTRPVGGGGGFGK